MLTWIDEVLNKYREPKKYIVSLVVEYQEFDVPKVWNEVLVCEAISKKIALDECLKVLRKKLLNKNFRIVSKLVREFKEN